MLSLWHDLNGWAKVEVDYRRRTTHFIDTLYVFFIYFKFFINYNLWGKTIIILCQYWHHIYHIWYTFYRILMIKNNMLLFVHMDIQIILLIFCEKNDFRGNARASN
jgi:hypothetical protein